MRPVFYGRDVFHFWEVSRLLFSVTGTFREMCHEYFLDVTGNKKIRNHQSTNNFNPEFKKKNCSAQLFFVKIVTGVYSLHVHFFPKVSRAPKKNSLPGKNKIGEGRRLKGQLTFRKAPHMFLAKRLFGGFMNVYNETKPKFI